MGGYPELTKCCCRRLNEKWSDPEFNLESDEDNCLQGLEDDTPRGPSIDAVDLKHALGILTSVPNLMNPLGTMSLSALGKVLEQELPPPKSYPQSVHRVVSTLLISRRNIQSSCRAAFLFSFQAGGSGRHRLLSERFKFF